MEEIATVDTADTHASTAAPKPAKKPKPRARRKKKGEVRLAGVEHLFDGPADRTPLLELVGVGLSRAFMDMGRERLEDGTILYVFKHQDTRANLHITSDGRVFYYDWDGKSVDDRPRDFVETTRYRVISGLFHDLQEGVFGYDEQLHPALVERALEHAAEGLRLPVDSRYPAAYARAVSAWEEAERLGKRIAEDERDLALRERTARLASESQETW